jgi:hypothetical protein
LNRNRFVLYLSLIGMVILGCRLLGSAQPSPQNTLVPTRAPALTPVPTRAPALTSVQTPAPTKTPVPTADPLASAQACLAGTWEITDISNAIIAAIPPDLAKQYNLQYTGASGKGYYTLTPDGNVSMQADQMELKFTAKASVFDVPVTVSVDGQVKGKYSLKGNTLTTSDMDTSGITASAQALGQEVMTQEQIIRAIPLINAPYNTAEYTCSGDTLQLKLPSYPESIPPLVFHKVN